MLAVRTERLDIVMALMDHPDIDLNATNHANFTVLHTLYDPMMLEQLLSDKRIDTSIVVEGAGTALELALLQRYSKEGDWICGDPEDIDKCLKLYKKHGTQLPDDDYIESIWFTEEMREAYETLSD